MENTVNRKAPRPNQQLRAARVVRHLSQAEFAETVREQARVLGLNLACDEKRVGRWERGEVRWPSPACRRVLAVLLKVDDMTELGFVTPYSEASPPRLVLPERPMDLAALHGRRVHFVGIGGCGMSGLAAMLHEGGQLVSGSDQQDSENLHALQRTGITAVLGHDRTAVGPDVGLVVSTSAIASDNPEIRAARSAGIPVVDRAELLGAVMDRHPFSVAVAGTRGKTTTTALVGRILAGAGLDPTVQVGTTASGADNHRLGGGGYFVAEACEYHRAFWNLRPRIGVITNTAEDHSDCFPDVLDIEDAFDGFAQGVRGVLVTNADCRRTRRLVSAAYWGQPERGWVTFGLGLDQMRESVESFAGPPRRLVDRGEAGEVRVFDDIACHPGEISATLRAIRAVVGAVRPLTGWRGRRNPPGPGRERCR